VVTVHPENQAPFEDFLRGNAFAEVGKVIEGTAFKVVGLGGKTVVQADIFDLKEAWQRPLRF
jgi:phosphoribosylformylglycinamidine synthase